MLSIRAKKNFLPRMLETTGLFPLSKVFEKAVAGKLSHCLEGNSLLSISQFSYRSGLGTWNALLTLPHHFQVAFEREHGGKSFSVGLLSCF